MGNNIREVTNGRLYCLDENGNPIEIHIDFANTPDIQRYVWLNSVTREYNGGMSLSIDGRVSNLAFSVGESEQEEMEESSEALDDFLNQFERK